MPELNSPKGADATTRAAAASAIASKIDQADAAVMKDDTAAETETVSANPDADGGGEGGETSPKAKPTKPQPVISGRPEDDDGGEPGEPPAEPAEEPGADPGDEDDSKSKETTGQGDKPKGAVAEPDAKATPSQGDPFTPEEETLLRRSNATVEDVEYFRALPTAQRARAMGPLRNTVRNLDRAYGMSPEERGRAAEKERAAPTSASGQQKTPQGAPKLELDEAKVKATAEKLGITVEAVKEIAELTLGPVREAESQRQHGAQQAHADDWNRTVTAAVENAYGELSKQFPRLKEQAAFEALLREDETFAVFQAKVSRGMDAREAMLQATRERATLKFLPEVQHKNTEARARDKAKAVKSTAEPTGKSLKRGPSEAAPKARSVDEAHEQAMADSRV